MCELRARFSGMPPTLPASLSGASDAGSAKTMELTSDAGHLPNTRAPMTGRKGLRRNF